MVNKEINDAKLMENLIDSLSTENIAISLSIISMILSLCTLYQSWKHHKEEFAPVIVFQIIHGPMDSLCLKISNIGHRKVEKFGIDHLELKDTGINYNGGYDSFSDIEFDLFPGESVSNKIGLVMYTLDHPSRKITAHVKFHYINYNKKKIVSERTVGFKETD